MYVSYTIVAICFYNRRIFMSILCVTCAGVIQLCRRFGLLLSK